MARFKALSATGKVLYVGGTIIACLIVILVIQSASKSGGGGSSAQSAPPPIPTAIPAKLSVSRLTCANDVLGERVCTGTVTNVSQQTITDLQVVVHWTGGTDSDYGSIQINPLLSGQSSPFSVTTLRPNPQLQTYTVGFFKNLQGEDQFPVAQN